MSMPDSRGLAGAWPARTARERRIAPWSWRPALLLVLVAMAALGTVTVTVPTRVGDGSCSSRPTPFLKFGNGGESV